MLPSYRLWHRGGRYYYKLPGQKTYHSTGQTSLRKAHIKIAEILREGEPSRVTFGDYADRFFVWGECPWIARQHAKGRPFGRATAKCRRGYLVNHILPRWGGVAMETMNPVEVETWLAGLELANQTKNHILYTMALIAREAHRGKVIRFDPLAGIEPMGTDYRHRDALSLEEIGMLFPADRDKMLAIWGQPRWAVAYFIMLSTGMRVGEVCALLWGHIRWEIPAVLILQAVKADGLVGKPKNGHERSALLPKRTVELLTWWRGQTPCRRDGDYVIPWAKKLQTGPVDPKAVQRAWGPAALASGIPTAGRFLGAHALRHTYETRLRTLLPEEVLRYMIGHRSVAMSEHYDQANPEERVLRFAGQASILDGMFATGSGPT